jgi:hypothetical protein
MHQKLLLRGRAQACGIPPFPFVLGSIGQVGGEVRRVGNCLYTTMPLSPLLNVLAVEDIADGGVDFPVGVPIDNDQTA